MERADREQDDQAGQLVPPADGAADLSTDGDRAEQAAALIRDAAVQLKDFLADRRRESEELSRRMTRMEEALEQGTASSRHLTVLSIVVAVLAFISTTALWRLVQHTRDVESAFKTTVAEVQATKAASLEGISGLRDDVLEQAEAALRLEKQLAVVESVGNRSVDGIVGLKDQLAEQKEAAQRLEAKLGDTSRGIVDVGRDFADRLSRQSELTAAERTAMVKELKGSLAQIEKAIEDRSVDLRQQQALLEEATAKARAERQAMIREATRTVTEQLNGLQKMLDALEGPGESTAVEAVGAEPQGEETGAGEKVRMARREEKQDTPEQPSEPAASEKQEP